MKGPPRIQWLQRPPFSPYSRRVLSSKAPLWRREDSSTSACAQRSSTGALPRSSRYFVGLFTRCKFDYGSAVCSTQAVILAGGCAGVQERELPKLVANRRAVRMLNPLRLKDEGITVPGGEGNTATCGHGYYQCYSLLYSIRPLRVKPPTS